MQDNTPEKKPEVRKNATGKRLLIALATIAVVAAGLSLSLSRGEWCWVVLAIMAVWTAEALNTAVEFLADAAVPQRHPLVEKAKDAAAGAVLISAVGAAAIGSIVFLPRLARLL